METFDPGPNYTNAVMNNVDMTLIPDKWRPPVDGALTGPRVVQLSQYLRNKASQYFASAQSSGGNPAFSDIAHAHWNAAEAVEDAMTDHLTAIGQPQVASAWEAARTYGAKSFDVDAALDGAGNVAVPVLRGQMRKGVPLSGGVQQLATAGAMYPDLFKATPMRPAPTLLARTGAKVAPVLGAGLGSLLPSPLNIPGAAAGAAMGQHYGERLLR
jgi:hypothetical protein